MEKYINSNGNPIAYNGREIKAGDTLKVTACGLELSLAVYEEDGLLHAKGDHIRAYAETICRGSDKVEIVNR